MNLINRAKSYLANKHAPKVVHPVQVYGSCAQFLIDYLRMPICQIGLYSSLIKNTCQFCHEKSSLEGG